MKKHRIAIQADTTPALLPFIERAYAQAKRNEQRTLRGEDGREALNPTSTQTCAGGFDFANPDFSMMPLTAITRVLSRIPRFNAHIDDGFEWMVAHHLVLCGDLMLEVDPELEVEALGHDFSEWVVGDPVSPFKRALGAPFKAVENPIEAAMARRLGVSYPLPPLVKTIDNVACSIEASIGFSTVGPLPGLLLPGFVLQRRHAEMVSAIYALDRPTVARVLAERIQNAMDRRLKPRLTSVCATPSPMRA